MTKTATTVTTSGGLRDRIRSERIRLRLDWQRYARLLGVSFGGLYKIAGPSGTSVPQATRAAELEEQLDSTGQMTPQDAEEALAAGQSAKVYVSGKTAKPA